MSKSTKHARCIRLLSGLSVLATLIVPVVHAGDIGGSGLTPFQQSELDYADKLLANGLATYSQDVIAKLNLPPEIQDIRKVQGFCALGQFDKAKAVVDAKKGSDSPGAWTLRIALADGYYMWGRYKEAQDIYNSFFKKYPTGPANKSLKGFYIASAYKYAQMMLLTGDTQAAIKAYQNVLKAKPADNVKRQVEGELVEILVKEIDNAKDKKQRDAYIKQAQKYIDDLLWKQDLWFGRAIVAMAHIKKTQGDIDGAMKLVDEYKAQLKEIDHNLKVSAAQTGEDLTKLSPMAECRYMIGVIMEDEARKQLKAGNKQKALELLQGKVIGHKRDGRPKRSDGAIANFLIVFVKYPNTGWAPDAGKRFRELKALMKNEFGKTTRVSITRKQMDAVEKAQFKEARVLYNQKKFKEAIEAYLQVLSLFPESSTSVAGISELAASYIEEKEYMLADVVTGYLAERFCDNKEYSVDAGEKVLGIALKYNELNEHERADQVYETYFKYFKHHPRAAGELYRYALRYIKDKQYDKAMGYLSQIAEFHQDTPYYIDSLGQMATIYEQQDKKMDELKILKKMISVLQKKERPGYQYINAKFRFAKTLETMGPKYEQVAIDKYVALQKILSDSKARDKYQNTPDEAKANQMILQAVMLKQALADCRRKDLPPKISAYYEKKLKRQLTPAEQKKILNKLYKQRALKTLLELADKFPKSDYAPVALSQAGSIYTILKQPDEASKVLQRLRKEYPDSPQAKNAVFIIGSSLLDLGMHKEAIKYFKDMFEGGGNYTSAQYLKAGRILFDAGEYRTAIEAFDKVIKGEKSRQYLEPARVFKAESLLRVKDYEKAAEMSRKLMKDYPKSGYTIKICRNASEAFSALASKTSDEEDRRNLFNEAIKAMKQARRFARDDATKAQLNLALADIFMDKSKAEEEFGNKDKATEYMRDAVAAYQVVIMSGKPGDPALAPVKQEAYARCLPLMMQMKRWDDVLSDANAYISEFPHGKYIRQIRQYKNKARVSGGETAADDSTTTNTAADKSETKKNSEEK